MFKVPQIKNLIKKNTELALNIFNKGLYIKVSDNIYDAEKLMKNNDLNYVPISKYCKKENKDIMIAYMTKNDVEVQVQFQEWNDYEDRKCRNDCNPFSG
jgi:hypothetical protein